MNSTLTNQLNLIKFYDTLKEDKEIHTGGLIMQLLPALMKQQAVENKSDMVQPGDHPATMYIGGAPGVRTFKAGVMDVVGRPDPISNVTSDTALTCG